MLLVSAVYTYCRFLLFICICTCVCVCTYTFFMSLKSLFFGSPFALLLLSASSISRSRLKQEAHIHLEGARSHLHTSLHISHPPCCPCEICQAIRRRNINQSWSGEGYTWQQDFLSHRQADNPQGRGHTHTTSTSRACPLASRISGTNASDFLPNKDSYVRRSSEIGPSLSASPVAARPWHSPRQATSASASTGIERAVGSSITSTAGQHIFHMHNKEDAVDVSNVEAQSQALAGIVERNQRDHQHYYYPSPYQRLDD